MADGGAGDDASGGDGASGGDDASGGSLEQVLAHGGWWLIDPRPTAAAHPDTFAMPTSAELETVRRGVGVKAMFRLADLADPVRDGLAAYGPDGMPQLTLTTERMWLLVTGREGDLLHCLLDNQPFAAYTRLTVGVEVLLPTSHVIATGDGPVDVDDHLRRNAELGFHPLPESETTRPEDPTRRPTVRADQDAVCTRADVWPAPPWMFSSMLVATDLRGDREPLHGARFGARPERGDNGWVVFAGHRSMDEVAGGPGFQVLTVKEAAQREPRLLPYLALPEGWGFTSSSTGDDLYPVELED